MKIRTGIVAAVVGVLVGGVGTGVVMLNANPPKVQTAATDDSVVVTEELVRGFKISALTYRYTNFIYSEEVLKLGDVELPFSKAYLGVQYDGVMEIGIDASDLEVAQSGDQLVVTLPPVQILSHTLVKGSTHVVFDMSAPLNSNQIADYTRIFDADQTKMEERAKSSGVIDQATASVKEQLENLIYSIPGVKGKYQVTFKTTPA
ncbi:MAG: DUF4230 domain-containing protein [Propionibacteriaceae bacterium]|nr:DUF4230 domain-containing protein [Propionibacteriaceae bacterium]